MAARDGYKTYRSDKTRRGDKMYRVDKTYRGDKTCRNGPAGWSAFNANICNAGIFSDTVNVIHVILCLIVMLTGR